MLYLYDSRKKIACVVGALVLACTAGYYFFSEAGRPTGFVRQCGY